MGEGGNRKKLPALYLELIATELGVWRVKGHLKLGLMSPGKIRLQGGMAVTAENGYYAAV